MHHELEVVADPDAVADTAAAFVARLARACAQTRGRFTFAVSGGHTPWAMLARLAKEDVPWEHVAVFQVDERVAPDGDPDRNLTHLRESLGAAPAEVIAMPVNDADLDEAAAAYVRSKCSGSSPERTSVNRSRGSSRETGPFPQAGSRRRRRSSSRTRRRPTGALLAPATSRQHDHDARPSRRAGSLKGIRWLRTRRTFPRTCWSFLGSVATSRER
ncbi:6-phosphogluconolactonase [Streptomyces sp. NPDC002688]|uniref:6-phosphogluconolactonase n=1 Tax=Streptomyces sp. NPDC002688 TaxID=3154423 RepID=UPI00331CC8ED